MTERKIAVISADNALSRMIYLEASLFGYECDIFSTFSGFDKGTYGIIIVDIRTVSCPSSLPACISVSVSSNGKLPPHPERFSRIIDFPFPVSELRNIFEGNYPPEGAVSEPEGADAHINVKKSSVTFIRTTSEVIFSSQRIRLTGHEFCLFARLCKSPGKTVSHTELAQALGVENEKSNIINVYICRLRRKLESASGQKVIYTVRSDGFMTYYSMSEDM